MVNLNPIISTDPWALPYWNGTDPFNRALIEEYLPMADLVIAAWGAVHWSLSQKIALPELIYEFRGIAQRDLFCIGTTKNGAPLHPCRAPYTDRPVLWKAMNPE